MPSVSVKDVSQQDFVVAMAAHLKKSGKMKVPEWVDLVKTNNRFVLKLFLYLLSSLSSAQSH